MKKHLLISVFCILLLSNTIFAQNIELFYKFPEIKTKTDTSYTLKPDQVEKLKSKAGNIFIIITETTSAVNENWTCNGDSGTLNKKTNQIRFNISNEIQHRLFNEPCDTLVIRNEKAVQFARIVVNWNPKDTQKGNEQSVNREYLLTIPYTFLPNASDYPDLFKKVDTSSNIYSVKYSKKNEYRIRYDFRTRCISYPKTWLCGQKKKETNINRNICFEVININPLVNSVTVNNSVVNRNTELESKFVKFLAIPQDSAKSKGVSKAYGTKKDSDTVMEKLLNKFIVLSVELQYFYANKLSDPFPNLGLYKQELEFIKGKIGSKLLITGVIDKKSILEKGAQLIDSLKNKEKVPQYEKAVQISADLINKLDNIDYAIITGPIESGNNDEIDFDVTIKKGDVTVVDPTKYSVMLSGGFKADFSVGFYLTGLTDNLFALKSEEVYDTTFYLKNFVKTDSILDISKVQKQKIIKDDQGKNYIGMMLLGHFYPRTGYRANLALTAGFGIDAGLSSRYLLGGSLIWGYEKRIIFTAGCVWGKKKDLASGLKEGTYYSGDSNALQKDVFDHSWFVGVSFNLGSVPLTKKKSDQ
jgi:hypothetical protein